jgi:hypothetical protein
MHVKPKRGPNPVPSRRAAAAALRRIARKDIPLYTELDAPLRRAVLLYWGDMARARKALRLREPPARRQAWSRERVIDEIRKLHRAGQHMSTSALANAGRNDLVIAALKYVGSWVRARALAGVSFKANRVFRLPIWDAATVVGEIQARHEQRLPLALSKAPKSLTCAASRIFGSWRSAVGAAGIDYDSVLLLRSYDDHELLAWLRGLARKKPHMALFDLDKHGEHAVVCRRRWGSLEAAAKAAGLVGWPVRIRRRAMTRAQVVQALRKLHRSDQPTTISHVRDVPDGHYIINSAFHHFPTWKDALDAAELRADSDPRA